MKQICIKVQNTSEDKIYSVNLFKNKGNKVLIEPVEKSELSFKDILDVVYTHNAISSRTFVKCNHDYHKYQKRQLSASFKNKDSVFDMVIDPYQYQDEMILIAEDIKLKDLILSYLMPESTIYLDFYIE